MYSQIHTNSPWIIIAHISKTLTNPSRSEHKWGLSSCHSTGQYAGHWQGAGHWCRVGVDMHSILPSHSPPRSMRIAHTAKNPPECNKRLTEGWHSGVCLLPHIRLQQRVELQQARLRARVRACVHACVRACARACVLCVCVCVKKRGTVTISRQPARNHQPVSTQTQATACMY